MDDPAAYQAEGILYLTPLARFDHLLRLPGGADAGKAVNEAMRDIEANNPQLASVLPRTYQIFDSTLLKNLLKKLSEIPATAEGDTFGRIYEYFLGQFARTRGQEKPVHQERHGSRVGPWVCSESHGQVGIAPFELLLPVFLDEMRGDVARSLGTKDLRRLPHLRPGRA